MSKYTKAIAALVGAVAAVAVVFNVDISEETQAVIISVAVGLVTLISPANKP